MLTLLSKYRHFILLLVGIVLIGSANAQRFAVVNGNWNAPIWATTANGVAGSASTPTNADAVSIKNGITVTVNIDSAKCSSLIINNLGNGTGVLQFNVASALTISTFLQVGNTSGTTRRGSLIMTNGGLLKVGTTLSAPNLTTFDPGLGTIEMTGTNTLPTQFPNYNILKVSSGTTSLSTATTIDTLIVSSGSSLNQGSNSITLNGSFINTGNFTNGLGDFIISGSAAVQAVASFTTTGNVTMSKTSGTATFTGNVNANNLTVDGVGGTLNLGTGLTHTFTGVWSQNNGTLNGGSSTMLLTGTTSPIISGGTFTAASGTVEYNSSSNFQIGALNYNNLKLTGTSVKILSTSTISGNLSITNGSIASLSTGRTYIVSSLTLDGYGKINGTWGSTSNSLSATYTSNTYFDATVLNSGIVSVTNDTRPTLTITASNQTKTFGDTTRTIGVLNTHYTLTGSLVGSDATSTVTLAYSGTPSGNTSTAQVGTYNITPSGLNFSNGNASNYKISYALGNLNVIKDTIIVTARNNPVVYGSTISSVIAQWRGLSQGPVTYNFDTYNNHPIIISSVTITGIIDTLYTNYTPTTNAGTSGVWIRPNVSNLSATNYTFIAADGTITINGKPLTVTASGQTKTYGSTAPTSGTFNTNFTVTGLQGTDAVSGATLGYSGTPAGNTATAAVGSYTITPSALTLSSGSTSNYSISYVTGTLTVNAATLTVTASAQNKTYGSTAPTSGTLNTNFTVSGLQGTDAASTVTLVYSGTPSGDLATAAVGSYTIIPSALILSSGLLTNYAVSYNTGILSVNKAILIVTANNQTVQYGTPVATVTGAGSYSISGFVNSETSTVVSGSATFSTNYTATTLPGASGITITPDLSGLSAANYSFTAGNGTITVSRKTLTVTGAVAANKIYDGTTTVTIAGGSLSGVVGSDVVSLSQSGVFVDRNVSRTSPSDTNALPKSIVTSFTISGADTFKYNLQQPTLTAKIHCRKLTITASSFSKTYDGTLSCPLPPTITSGVVQTGDNAVFVQNYATKNAGVNISLQPSGVVTDGNSGYNYFCSFVDRNIGIITQASISITATGPQKQYGIALATTVSSTNFIVEDLPLTDTITQVTLNPDAAGQTANLPVGSTYTVTPSLASGTATSFLSSNFSITYIPFEGTVTQKLITIINAVTTDKVYDGTPTAVVSGGTLSGVVSGDTVSLTLSAEFNNSNVGINKPITSTSTISGAAASNYTLVQPDLTARNITARSISVYGEKIYDGDALADAPPLALTNNVDGSNLVLSGTALASSRNVGTWPVVNAPSISRVQYKAANTTTALPTSFSVTLTAAPVNGNTLVAVFSTRNATTNNITSIVQNGATWSRAVQSAVSNSNSTVEIWYASNVQNASANITVNQLASNTAVVFSEYTGVLVPAPMDVTASNATAANSTTASTGTTSTPTAMANELLIGGIGLANSTFTLGSPINLFTSVSLATSTGGTTNARVYLLEKITSAIGVANTGGTISGLTGSSGAIAAFKSVTPLTLSGTAASNYTVTGMTGNFKIVSGAPIKLVIDSISTQTAGTGFNITVKSCDAFGNPTAVSDSLPVELSMVSGSDTLNGTLIGSIPRGESAVIFSGLSYYSAEDSVTIQATDLTAALRPDTSNYFSVKPGLLSTFAVRDTFGGEIPSQRVGLAFPIRIYAQDAYGNTDTSFRGSVLLTSTGNLSSGGGATGVFSNGILSSRNVTISNSGNFTITATRNGGGAESGTSNEFLVGQVYYSIANGNWESNSTWSTSPTGSTAASSFPQNSDIAYIRNTNAVTITAASDSCQSIYFTGASPRLIVNSNTRLAVAQTIQVFSSGSSNITASVESAGEITCRKLKIGSNVVVTGTNLNTTFNSTVGNLTITDSIVLLGSNTTARRNNYRNNSNFNLNSGNLTVANGLFSIGQKSSSASFTTASGTSTVFTSSTPQFYLGSIDNRGTVSLAVNFIAGSRQFFSAISNQNIPVNFPSSKAKTSAPVYANLNYTRLTVSGAGTKSIIGGAIAVSDSLIINQGVVFKLDSSNRINSTLTKLRMNGGTLSTGTPLKGYAATFGVFDLKENSVISLGQESHNIRFLASDLIAWTVGKRLTITDWMGIRGNTGVGGRIYVGTNALGLTSTQLDQIKFFDGRDSFPAGLLRNGELIPIGYLRYAVNNGNWNSTSTWSETSGGTPGASVPGSGDNVFIENGYTVTVTGNAYCSNLVMGSNQITGTWAVGKINVPTITDTLTVYNEMLANNYETGINVTGTIFGNGTVNTENLSCGLPFRISSAVSRDTMNISISKLNVNNEFTIYNNVQPDGVTGAFPVINVNNPCSLSVHKIILYQTGNTFNNSGKLIKFNAETGTYISLAGGINPITVNSNSLLKSGNVLFTLNRSTFNYNSYDSSQNIPFSLSNEDLVAGTQSNPALNYGNLHINNYSTDGAKITEPITNTNVTDTILIGNLNRGSSFSTNGNNIQRGANDYVSVDSSSTINMGSQQLSWSGTGGKIDIKGIFKTADPQGFSGSTSTSISSSNSPAITLGSGSTIEYNSTGTQLVSQRTDYANLTLTGSLKTMPAGTVSVSRDLLINSGANLDAATNNTIINLSGDLTNNQFFTAGTGLFTFNGSASRQHIKGIASVSFRNISINNPLGISLDGNSVDAQVSGVLNFINGKITTNANNLILQSTASVSGAGAGKYVFGNLRKFIAANATTTQFEIGDSSVYAPIKLDYAGTISANTGSITTYTIRNDYGSISGSGLNASKTVNRHWVVNNNTVIPGLVSYNPTFNFVAADIDAGSNTNNFVVRRYFAGIWDTTLTGSRTATSTQAINLSNSSFGVFQIGESSGKPTYTNPADTAVCAGANVSFTSTPTSAPYPTIKWQRSTDGVNWVDITTNLDAGTVYGGISSTTLTLTGTSNTINGYRYRAVMTNVNGTSFTNEALLTIRTAPVIVSQPVATAQVCSGAGLQKIYVNATGFGLTYTWRRNGGILSNNTVISGQGTDTLYLTNPTSANNGNYDVIISGGCTPSVTSGTVAISVKSLPTLTGNSQTRCGAGQVTLFATPSSGAIVEWFTTLSGGTSIATGNSYTTPTLLNTTVYYAQAYNATTTCTTANRVAVTATIRNLPQLPEVRDSSRCGSGTVVLTATLSGSTIEWYADSTGGGRLATGNTFTTPVLNDTTVFYALAVDSFGCTLNQRAAVTAFVNSIPSAPAATNGQRCGSGSVSISATASSGSLIDWYSVSVGGSALLTNSNTFNTPSITLTTNYYAVSRNAITGCTSTRTAVQAKINPLPAAPSAGNNAVCNSGSVVITAIVQSGQTADWYDASTGGTLLASGNTAFTTPVINTTTNYYALTRDIATGCTSSTRTLVQAIVNFGVSTSSVNIISSVPGNRICAGSTVTFNAVPSNPGTNPFYQWKVNGVNAGSDTTVFVTSGLSNNSVVTLTMSTNGGTCSDDTTVISNVITISVSQLPNPATATDKLRCGAGPITLTAQAGTGQTIDWYGVPAGGLPLAEDTIRYYIPNLTATDTFYVQARDTAVGCLAASRTRVIASIASRPDSVLSIVGDQLICKYLNQEDSIAKYYVRIANGSTRNLKFKWVLPLGVTFADADTTRDTIRVRIDSRLSSRYGRGIIWAGIISDSGCYGGFSSIRLYKDNPNPIGAITMVNAQANICEYLNTNTVYKFYVAPGRNYYNYLWTVPTGVTIVNSTIQTNPITNLVDSVILFVKFDSTFVSGSSISVNGISWCGNKSSSIRLYRNSPLAPASIQYSSLSDSLICPVGDQSVHKYWVNQVSNATSYEWVLPAHVTLVGNPSTLFTDTIRVKFDSLFVSSVIKVRSISNCGVSAYKSFTIRTSYPDMPGVITGPANACLFVNPQVTVSYTIRKVAGAQQYDWRLPNGVTLISRPGLNTVNDTIINVRFTNAFNPDSSNLFSVRLKNCNWGPYRTFSVNKTLPNAPTRIYIRGLNNICQMGPVDASGYVRDTFYIQRTLGATKYLWDSSILAPRTTISSISAQNDTVVVRFHRNDTNNNVIKVYAVNGCGASAPASLTMRKNWPTIARYVGQIFANNICANRIYKYSLSQTVAYADSIIWTLPAGAQIISGRGTRIITVLYPSNVPNIIGTVSAKGINTCGVGAGSSLSVNISPCSRIMNLPDSFTVAPRPSNVNNELNIKIFPLPTTSTFHIQVNNGNAERIELKILDLQGRVLLSSSMYAGELKELGNELKPGYYLLEIKQAGLHITRKLLKL